MLVMDIPSGYICRLRRYPLSKLPTDLSEIDDLISMVSDVLIAKVMNGLLNYQPISYIAYTYLLFVQLRITRCLKNSNNPSDRTSIDSNEALKKRLKKKSINRRQENDDYEFPSSQKTPKKRKTKKSE